MHNTHILCVVHWGLISWKICAAPLEIKIKVPCASDSLYFFEANHKCSLDGMRKSPKNTSFWLFLIKLFDWKNSKLYIYNIEIVLCCSSSAAANENRKMKKTKQQNKNNRNRQRRRRLQFLNVLFGNMNEPAIEKETNEIWPIDVHIHSNFNDTCFVALDSET